MGRALILIIRQEHRGPRIEINVDSWIYAMTFSANGEYLLSGGGGVRVWRVEDGTQVARMEAKDVRCLAVSKDGRWIAAGTCLGDVFVWDARTHEQVFKHWEESSYAITGVDFSPDSTRLVSASTNQTASIWDILTGKQLQTLRHSIWVRAAKYSPQGGRIATATKYCIRVWDSKDGRLLLDINVGVDPLYNTGLLWSNNHLFVISGNRIQQIDASTGSVVSEWSVPISTYYSCITLPNHGQFIAYSANRAITFWDTSSHTQLGHIQHPQDIHSTALSPDDEVIAIGGEGGKVCLSRTIVSVLFRLIVERASNPDLFARRIRSLCLIDTQYSRNQSLRSTTPRSVYGSSVSLRMQKHH